MARKSVYVDYSGLDRKIDSLLKKIDQGSTLTAKQLAQVGVFHAFNLAPKDTTTTAQHIRAKPKTLSKSVKSWVIEAKEPYKWFPIVKRMHANDAFAKSHWRNRLDEERKFMHTTRDYLNSIKGKVASGNFRTIKIIK